MKNVNHWVLFFFVGLLHLGVYGQTESCGCDSLYSGTIVEIFDENCTFFTGQNATTSIPEDAKRYCYGYRRDQWFDFYRATSPNGQPVGDSNARPIYLWAHGNSGSADIGQARRIWDSTLATKGIHFLSWESIAPITTQNVGDLVLTYLDLQKLVKSLKDEVIPISGSGAPFISNVDPTRIFVGGVSRGSLVSWNYTQLRGDEIKGAYFAQALPNLVWVFAKPTDWVNRNSPPLVLNYGQQYHSQNFHDAVNGKLVYDAYQAYGKECVIRHSMGDNADLYDGLVYFINGGSFPAVTEIDVDNLTPPVKYDGKDAECNLTYYDGPLDSITSTICAELSLGDEDERPDPLSLTYNSLNESATFEWTEGNWVDPLNNTPDPFDAANDFRDYCMFRVFKTENADLTDGIDTLDTPRLPRQGALDADGLGATDWPIPAEYLGQSEDVFLAFQAKCVINGFETDWSEHSILTIEAPSGAGIIAQHSGSAEGDQHIKISYDEVQLSIKTTLEGQYQLRVYNLMGQEVMATNLVLNEGMNAHPMSSGLSQGMYIVSIRGEGAMVSEKIFVR